MSIQSVRAERLYVLENRDLLAPFLLPQEQQILSKLPGQYQSLAGQYSAKARLVIECRSMLGGRPVTVLTRALLEEARGSTLELAQTRPR